MKTLRNMGKHKWCTARMVFILIFACCLLIIVCRFLFIAEKPLINQVKFYEGGRYGIELDPYYDEEENIYYLFVPAYASMEDITIECAEFIKCDFSDHSVDFGSDMAELPLSEDITLTLTNFYQKETYDFQIWQYDNLPTVYIETETGSMDQVNADKDYEEEASVLVINSDGSIGFSDMSTISGRGNATWERSKKPYTLKFSSEIDMGPFESTDSLCLLANYSDESRIRNAIAYYAGEEIGIPYSSPYMNVNVYANGEYLGLYGIVSKNEYQKYIESDQIKAVFEMSIMSVDEESFIAGLDDRVNVMYGDTSEVQYAVGQLETALRMQDWELCDSLIDIESFAERYVFEEIIADQDIAGGNGYGSKYFFLDNEGIIHCMLPWDHDLSLANTHSFFNNKQEYELVVHRNTGNWFEVLLENNNFVQEVLNVLKTEYSDQYFENLMQYIVDLVNDVSTSWECDMIRWKNEPPYDSWQRSSGMESLYLYIDYFSQYFPARRSFLINYFSDPGNYCRIEFRASTPYPYDYFNIFVPSGDDLSTYIEGANVLEVNRRNRNTFSGWHTEDGQSVYDIGTVTEDLYFTGTYETVQTEEANVEAITTDALEVNIDNSSGANSVMALLKRIYHFLGLDAFGRRRLVLCGVFALFFLGLIVEEVVRYRRQKRQEK